MRPSNGETRCHIMKRWTRALQNMKDSSDFVTFRKNKYARTILFSAILAALAIVWTLGDDRLVAGVDKPGPTLFTSVPLQPPEVQNVILLSWDGLDRSVVKELLTRKKVPGLAHLLQEGSFQEIAVHGHATVTKPGHAEILTGLSADITGVHANWLGTYRPIPEGYTIFERLQTRFGKDNIATIFVAGKLAHLGGRGPGEPIRPEQFRATSKWFPKGLPKGADDVLGTETIGEPFFLTKKHLNVFDIGQRDSDVVGPLCLRYLNQYKSKRFLAFFHCSDTDHVGHHHGSASSEYREAAVDCDKWLGRIISWLKQEKLYASTLIYVTTDHGFDLNARTHGHAPHSWLVTNDKLVSRGGILADIAATILVRFGLDLEKLAPPLLGQPL
ncbi:MAG: alkaline phosphatase family protein [Pseudomonadota bacterium]